MLGRSASCARPLLARGVSTFHTKFRPYGEILARLEATAAEHEAATLQHVGPLAVLSLNEGLGLPQVWLQAGIHACEWAGPSVVMRLADELLETPEVLKLAEWHLAPVVAVDGYELSWTKDRFWKGSASGVNGNANYPFHWGEMPPMIQFLRKFVLALDIGDAPMSEPCVKAVVDGVRSKKDLRIFVDFHSAGNRWLYPWAYTKDPPTDREAQLAASEIAVSAANALRHGSGEAKYLAMPAHAMEGVCIGGTGMDWAYSAGCVHSYAVELPPSVPANVPAALLRGLLRGDPELYLREAFLLPEERIKPMGDEMTASIFALVKHVLAH